MVTYVNNLGLSEIATGDSAGNWGVLTNTSLELIGEALGYATEQSFGSDADATSIVDDGATSPVRSIYFKVTSAGSLTATRQLLITPDTIKRLMFIENATTGGESIKIKQGTGTAASVIIPNGQTKAVTLNGGGTGAIVADAFAALNVGANLYVKNPATTDDSTANIYLQTAEADIAVNDVLGKINFQAPDETSHAAGDNKLVAAAIQAISEGDFSQTNNATSLAFMTAASEAATTKMTLSSVGDLTLTSTTASTSSTTGSLIVGGGLGVAADLFVGDDFDVAGDAVIDLTCLVTGVLTTTAATVFNGGFAAGGVGTFADGSVSAPSITNTGDLNTGLYFPAADQVGLTVAGTQRLNVSATGIDVTGTMTAAGGIIQSDTALLRIQSNTTAAKGVSLGYNHSTSTATLLADHQGVNQLAIDYYGLTHTFGRSSSVEFLTIDSSGNITIATGGDLITNTLGGTTNLRLGVDAGDGILDGALYNTLVGSEAGTAITLGDGNTALGYQNSIATTEGTYNSIVGSNAFINNISGNANSGIGHAILYNNTADSNTALGYYALFSNTSGTGGVAVGRDAGEFATTADNSTFVGFQAGQGITGAKLTGNNNTALGKDAGLLLQGTANANTLLGATAGDNITTGDSNIIIGNGIDAASATADGQLNIGGWIQGAAGQITIGVAASTANDGTLTVKGDDRLHPVIKAAGVATNGFTLLADQYQADESVVNLGLAYSSAELVLSRGVKVSNAADNAYLSSQATFAAQPSAIRLSNGTMKFLSAASSATVATDSAVTMVERLKVQHTAGANVVVADGLTLTDGNLVVADGHGIDFSAADSGLSSTSNLLDDYEEGTFTMGFTGASISLGSAVGAYTKIGRVVTWSYYSNSSDISSASGNAVFTGLPFTVLNSDSAYSPINIAHNTFFGGSTTVGTQGYNSRNSTTGNFNTAGLTATSTFVDGNGKYIMMSGAYITSA